MKMYVLDSDHLSLHQRGYESLKAHLLKVPPHQIYITIISVEELLRGRLAQIRRTKKSEERVQAYYWLERTLSFLCSFKVLKYSSEADAYFQKLRAKKIRINVQDLKIASITLSKSAILVTRNRRDFDQVPSLKIEDWTISNS